MPNTTLTVPSLTSLLPPPYSYYSLKKYIFFSYLYLLGLLSASILPISFPHHTEDMLQSTPAEVTTGLRYLWLSKVVLLNSEDTGLKALPLSSLFLSFFAAYKSNNTSRFPCSVSAARKFLARSVFLWHLEQLDFQFQLTSLHIYIVSRYNRSLIPVLSIPHPPSQRFLQSDVEKAKSWIILPYPLDIRYRYF